ncbi:MAG: hypothetical protein RI907_3877, partial [Pseudomonadota bacterium]|jgi:receptor protein-tyrosine kinase
MGTIEDAAKRIEQLRRAGIITPNLDAAVGLTPAAAAPPAAAPNAPSPAVQPQLHPQPPVQTHAPSQPLSHEPLQPPPPSITIEGEDVITITLPSGGAPSPEAASFEQDIAPGERRSRLIQADLLGMQRHGLLIPGAPRSQLEEEFRIVKRPLLENISSEASIRPERANLIMVTSAMPGEGKTQSAINLAVSVAMELDRTVLLVEADVLKPSLLHRMGMQAQHGLLDLLAGDVTDLSEVLLRTNIPKLSVLPAGQNRTSATELLASAAMEALLNDLSNRYPDRVIIFDTPPLISTTESRVLATHMGQVVMVVEAHQTPLPTIKQAFTMLESHPVVMSVLNKYVGPKSGETYGYYAP